MSEVLSRVEAEWAVSQAVGKLMGACDDQDWGTVLKCLSMDFELYAVNQPVRVQGADTFVNWQKTVLPPGTRAQHIMGPITVTLQGEQAEAATMSTSYIYPIGEPDAPVKKSGTKNTYQLRREGGQWKVASCAVNAMWQEGGKLLTNPVELGAAAPARSQK